MNNPPPKPPQRRQVQCRHCGEANPTNTGWCWVCYGELDPQGATGPPGAHRRLAQTSSPSTFGKVLQTIAFAVAGLIAVFVALLICLIVACTGILVFSANQ